MTGWLKREWDRFANSFEPEIGLTGTTPMAVTVNAASMIAVFLAAGYFPPLARIAGLRRAWVSVALTLVVRNAIHYRSQTSVPRDLGPPRASSRQLLLRGRRRLGCSELQSRDGVCLRGRVGRNAHRVPGSPVQADITRCSGLPGSCGPGRRARQTSPHGRARNRPREPHRCAPNAVHGIPPGGGRGFRTKEPRRFHLSARSNRRSRRYGGGLPGAEPSQSAGGGQVLAPDLVR